MHEIEKLAINIRIKTIESIAEVGKGHVGGSMSIADTLAVLFGQVMKIDPSNPGWEMRDWLVFSKGHSGPALYSALALKGYIPLEWLNTMNKIGSNLPSHVNRLLTPGIDVSTGSLGQGLSVAVGLALADQIDKRDSYVYCIIGDGECQEGQIWEALLFAGNHALEKLILLVDDNKKQCGDFTVAINDVENIEEKISNFGFHVQRIDGHNTDQIYNAIAKAKENCGKPNAIIMNTIKGKGCSFCEELKDNHHIPVSKKQAEEAISKLKEKLK